MSDFFLLMKIFILLLTFGYVVLITVYLISWNSIKEFFLPAEKNSVFVSVIIAARNEEKNILNCLQHLVKQNYSVNLFEIIISNDFSDDNTQQIIEKFIIDNSQVQIKLLNLNTLIKKDQGSKKSAITEAIKFAKGDLIITTDADCTMQTNWVKTIASYYEKHQPYLISGPVIFAEKKFFDKIQSLEFISLVATGAASVQAGYPLMCNAANLAFKKDIYFALGRDNISNEPFSGDDTFLMFAIHNKFKNKIAFLKSVEAIVTTQAQPTLKEFFNQRKRWASKVKSYSSFYVKFIGIFLFLFNSTLVFTGISLLVNSYYMNIFIGQMVIKLIIDFIFLYRVSEFFTKSHLMRLFLLVEILYVGYILILSIATLGTTYSWKKRKIKI